MPTSSARVKAAPLHSFPAVQRGLLTNSYFCVINCTTPLPKRVTAFVQLKSGFHSTPEYETCRGLAPDADADPAGKWASV
jgi:hypothetical protein